MLVNKLTKQGGGAAVWDHSQSLPEGTGGVGSHGSGNDTEDSKEAKANRRGKRQCLTTRG